MFREELRSVPVEVEALLQKGNYESAAACIQKASLLIFVIIFLRTFLKWFNEVTISAIIRFRKKKMSMLIKESSLLAVHSCIFVLDSPTTSVCGDD